MYEPKIDDPVLKILLVGDSSVGKTCLLNRFVENTFDDLFISTVGIDFKLKTVCIREKPCVLQIWDTSGQSRFKTVIATYFRNANGILIVYDVANQKSFDGIPDWIDHVRTNARPDVQLMLVGNKADLEEKRVVSSEAGRNLAEKHQISYFWETSAFTEFNVERCFHSFAEALLDTHLSLQPAEKTPQSPLIKKSESKDSVYQKCCRWFCFQ